MSGLSMTKTQSLFSIYPQSQSSLSTVTVYLIVRTGNTSANSMCCMYESLYMCIADRWNWWLIPGKDTPMFQREGQERGVVGFRRKGHQCVCVPVTCD